MESNEIEINISTRKILIVVVVIIAIILFVNFRDSRSTSFFNRRINELTEKGYEINDKFAWWRYKSGHPVQWNEFFPLEWSAFVEKLDSLQYENVGSIIIYIDETDTMIWFRIPTDEYSGEIYHYKPQLQG